MHTLYAVCLWWECDQMGLRRILFWNTKNNKQNGEQLSSLTPWLTSSFYCPQENFVTNLWRGRLYNHFVCGKNSRISYDDICLPFFLLLFILRMLPIMFQLYSRLYVHIHIYMFVYHVLLICICLYVCCAHIRITFPLVHNLHFLEFSFLLSTGYTVKNDPFVWQLRLVSS